MMKLKLDMPLKDFYYRFGVSQSTASPVFSLWKVALDIRLSPLLSAVKLKAEQGSLTAG